MSNNEVSIENQSKALGMTINELSMHNAQLITELNLSKILLKEKGEEINDLQSQLEELSGNKE